MTTFISWVNFHFRLISFQFDSIYRFFFLEHTCLHSFKLVFNLGKGERKLTFILYLLLTQPVFGTGHTLSHSILSTVWRCWDFSHFKDEKLMARNQHAQDHLIREWQSRNSNKIILLFFFFCKGYYVVVVFSRPKFLQIPHTRYQANHLKKSDCFICGVCVCEVHVLKCLSEYDNFWKCSMLEFCDVSKFAEVWGQTLKGNIPKSHWNCFFLYGLSSPLFFKTVMNWS